jgi:hypothetical protein
MIKNVKVSIALKTLFYVFFIIINNTDKIGKQGLLQKLSSATQMAFTEFCYSVQELWLSCSKKTINSFSFTNCFTSSVIDDGYPRNASCALNLIYMFLFYDNMLKEIAKKNK